MKRTLIQSVSSLSVVAAMCMIVKPVLACSCFEVKSAKEGLKRADTVFVGKVVDIGHQKYFTKVRVNLGNGKSKLVTAGEHYYKVKLLVSRSWKGAPDRTVFVLTNLGSVSCGFSFAKGKNYLVYAYKERKSRPNGDKHLYTSICQRTEHVSKAKRDLVELGKGKVPLRQ